MTPVLSHALEGLIVELSRLEVLLKTLECLDSRRTKQVLKHAREKFRSVADSLRAHLHAEAPEGTFSAPSQVASEVPSGKRQRTLDPVLFAKSDADPKNHHAKSEEKAPQLVLNPSPHFEGVTHVQLGPAAERVGSGSAPARNNHAPPTAAHK